VVNEILDLEAKSLLLTLLTEFKLFLRETFLILLEQIWLPCPFGWWSTL